MKQTLIRETRAFKFYQLKNKNGRTSYLVALTHRPIALTFDLQKQALIDLNKIFKPTRHPGELFSELPRRWRFTSKKLAEQCLLLATIRLG